MEVQGNIFASEEEFERECIDELKDYFTRFFNALTDFSNNFKLSQDNYQIIENISVDHDTKSLVEKNKSLMTGGSEQPKRILYKEYSPDLNYYIEHFNYLKSRLKGKSQKELKEIYKEIFSQVNSFLDDIIKEEESDPINQRVIQVAKDFKRK